MVVVTVDEYIQVIENPAYEEAMQNLRLHQGSTERKDFSWCAHNQCALWLKRFSSRSLVSGCS